jgi:hypothetical protein
MTEITKVSPARLEQPPERRLQTLALALLDHASATHRLPTQAWLLLQLAAAYYSAAQLSDAARSDRVGRDLVLATSIPDLTPNDQAIVACVVAFQREKLRPRRVPAGTAEDVRARTRSPTSNELAIGNKPTNANNQYQA